jgi:hypothetical protein
MEPRQPSIDLLAHFDRPKTDDRVAGVQRWDAPEIANDSRAPSSSAGAASPKLRAPTSRGILWVLQWAAAVSVLTFAAFILTQFSYQISVERQLAMAARAGVVEATLPRATYESVREAIAARLIDNPRLVKQLNISVTQNGRPVQKNFLQIDGARFAVTLSAPEVSALPEWLGRFTFRHTDSRILVHAEKRVPGRKLQPN